MNKRFAAWIELVAAVATLLFIGYALTVLALI